MPYIEKEIRERLDPALKTLSEEINTVGKLNYSITRLCYIFLNSRPIRNYTSLNEIVGVLECAKAEFYRRIISLYEDKKCLENGEVYIDE